MAPWNGPNKRTTVSYTHLRAHETAVTTDTDTAGADHLPTEASVRPSVRPSEEALFVVQMAPRNRVTSSSSRASTDRPTDRRPPGATPHIGALNNKKHLKNLGPFATASCLTPIHQVSLAVLSCAACASMSTTSPTTTTTRDNRGDRYGPMEWAQQKNQEALPRPH